MADSFAKTRYRVAQHWRFRSDTPEARDVLVITAVEDHPVQGIVCAVRVAYDPPFQLSRNSSTSGSDYWFTQLALDESVTELVAEKGLLPKGRGSTGEFRRDAESWGPNPQPMADTRTVGEAVREAYARLVRIREAEATRRPYSRPPDEALGLWTLIARHKVDRFRELLKQHPSLVSVPLRQDPSDEYCYSGEEYQECYPLMLAAELSSVKVAKVLLEFGADVHKRNDRGETALHFSGKAKSGGCGADVIARMLCERGADPNAANREGKPPLTCYYSMNEVAEVLVEFGARLDLNYALRLERLDWVRQQLRDNPKIVEEASTPEQVVDHVVSLMASVAQARLGSWDFDDLSLWYRAAEVEKQVFEEHRDILEGVVERGANPKEGWALFSAIHCFDTSLAAWLLERGVDPNRDLKERSFYLPTMARTQRMANLLKQYGALECPYQREMDPWEEHAQRLKEQFV